MPLLVSPMDGKTPMQQIVRDGIEIDRCPVSGGIWLDAGELEKLLASVHRAATQDREEYHTYRQSHPQSAHPQPQHAAPPPGAHGYQGRPHKYDDDYDDYHHRKYGRKSRLKSLLDIFD